MRKVSLTELSAGMVLDKDIFDSNIDSIPLLRKNSQVSAVFLDKLRRRGVDSVYVRDDAPVLKQGDRQKKVFVPKQKPVIAPALRDDAVNTLSELFDSISDVEKDTHTATVRIIKHIDKVVEQLVDSIGGDKGALININDLKSYDEYTFHHSLSVAVLSIAIGQHMGFDKGELNLLGRCAIMHDIGKTAVPIEIIHKPSRLSDEEFSIVKGHSSSGYDYLKNQGIGDENMWHNVLSHHEKFDGTGYPNHLAGGDIPAFSRIISVADVYDALTSNRPYRDPMQPAEAIEYIMGGVGSSFDFDMVDSFVKKVGLYPVGSYVELSDGQQAVVVNNDNNLRPVVHTLETGATLDLYSDRKCLSLIIRRVIPDGERRA